MLKARHLRHPFRAAHTAQQLLRFHAAALKQARTARRTYKDDPRFHLDVVEQGFRSYIPSPEASDEQFLHRICDAYNAATSVPLREVYRPTKWWEAFRRTSLQPVIQALEKRDIVSLQQMYGNFFRDACSDGLVRKTPLLNPSLRLRFRRAHQSAYLSEALLRLDTWNNLTNGKHDLRCLSGSGIGNPFGTVLDGVLIPLDAVHQHYCAQRIGRILGAEAAVVAEIGGGYGGMAYYLLRDFPRVTYINFDVPESLALAAYYLMKSFPEKRFLLCGEATSTNISLHDIDVVLLPLPELSSLDGMCADLLFSSHVLSDLGPGALNLYLAHVSRLAKKYFLLETMCGAAGELQTKISSECASFVLNEEKRFAMFACNRGDNVQWELLYERTSAN